MLAPFVSEPTHVQFGIHLNAPQAISRRDDALTTALLVTLRAFSYTSGPASQLVEAGLLNLAPQLLVRHFQDPGLPVVVELMWNVMENAPQARAACIFDGVWFRAFNVERHGEIAAGDILTLI